MHAQVIIIFWGVIAIEILFFKYQDVHYKKIVCSHMIFTSQREKSLHVFSDVNFHEAEAWVATLLSRENHVATLPRENHLITCFSALSVVTQSNRDDRDLRRDFHMAKL